MSDLRVGVGVGAPQGARGDVLDVEPPPSRVEAGRLGTGQRVRGIRGTGCPQQARALTAAGPVAGRPPPGRRPRASRAPRTRSPRCAPTLAQATCSVRHGLTVPGRPAVTWMMVKSSVDVGQGVTALRPPDVGAPAGADEGFDGRGGRARRARVSWASSTVIDTVWATSACRRRGRSARRPGPTAPGDRAKPARASTPTQAPAEPGRRRARGRAWRGRVRAWRGRCWWATLHGRGALGSGRLSSATVRVSRGREPPEAPTARRRPRSPAVRVLFRASAAPATPTSWSMWLTSRPYAGWGGPVRRSARATRAPDRRPRPSRVEDPPSGHLRRGVFSTSRPGDRRGGGGSGEVDGDRRGVACRAGIHGVPLQGRVLHPAAPLPVADDHPGGAGVGRRARPPTSRRPRPGRRCRPRRSPRSGPRSAEMPKSFSTSAASSPGSPGVGRVLERARHPAVGLPRQHRRRHPRLGLVLGVGLAGRRPLHLLGGLGDVHRLRSP